jgi:SnoaL-like domain
MLDDPPDTFARQPYFDQTLTLLRSVRDHDFDALAQLCDDDFGIVDGDPAGTISIIRTREEWERWFRELFATLDTMGAHTDSEITRYDAKQTTEMGFSALEFRQFLRVGESTATFECVATIVWKLTPLGWREARWHVSVVSADIPEALRPPT